MSAIATGRTTSDKTLHAPETINTGSSELDGEIYMLTNDSPKERATALSEIEAPAVITINKVTSGAITFMTNKFFLQSITKPKLERFQIIETFGDSKLFFFGERTKVYSIQGLLLEGEDLQADILMEQYTSNKNGLAAYHNSTARNIAEETNLSNDEEKAIRALIGQYRWSTAFQTFYDKHLRGTRLAETDSIAGIYFEKSYILGYPLQLQVQRDANSPFLVQFNMTWAVFKEDFLENYTSHLYTPEKIKDPVKLKEFNSFKQSYMEAQKLYFEAQEKRIKLETEKQNRGMVSGAIAVVADPLSEEIEAALRAEETKKGEWDKAYTRYRIAFKRALVARAQQ